MGANELLLLVVINTIILLIFACSFMRIRGGNWRSLGVLPAFLVALFTEMYGFPLTVYLLSGWLANHYPKLDPFAFSAGQLWQTLLGRSGPSVQYSIYVASYTLTAGGFLLIAYAWRVLYDAQKVNKLACSGPYAWVRHPQYLGFILIMFGLLLAWPALSTAIMFPIMTLIYARLAQTEERTLIELFGQEYEFYRRATPAFLPRLGRLFARS
jgi:protein-S-isoprenylcysteine O-methyltransferase Ste14